MKKKTEKANKQKTQNTQNIKEQVNKPASKTTDIAKKTTPAGSKPITRNWGGPFMPYIENLSRSDNKGYDYIYIGKIKTGIEEEGELKKLVIKYYKPIYGVTTLGYMSTIDAVEVVLIVGRNSDAEPSELIDVVKDVYPDAKIVRY
jgi:hypothetical protein